MSKERKEKLRIINNIACVPQFPLWEQRAELNQKMGNMTEQAIKSKSEEVQGLSSYISRVPTHTKEAIDRYVEHHIPTGGFLRAVLSNDLLGAMSKGDQENIVALKDIVMYLYNEAPVVCWGSKEKVKDWINS